MYIVLQIGLCYCPLYGNVVTWGLPTARNCYTANAADHTDLSYWHPFFEVQVSSIYTSLAEMEAKSLTFFLAQKEHLFQSYPVTCLH